MEGDGGLLPAGANPGAFFGATTLGATDPFFDAAASTQRYPFHGFGPEAFAAAFDAYALGAGSAAAATLGVDGAAFMPRAKLGACLNGLLGRPGSRAELQAWFTFLDYDGGALISRGEFEAAAERLREFSACPQSARQYSSWQRWRSDRAQHRRVGWSPQATLHEPLTASQQIGWHAAKVHTPQPGERFAVPHTDVTLREGRNAATYFGHLTLL